MMSIERYFFRAIAVIALTIPVATQAFAQSDWLGFTHEVEAVPSVQSMETSALSECLILTEDTVLESDVPCIQVGDGVAIDLNGFTVNGSIYPTQDGWGNDVTVQNGTVAGGAIFLLGDVLLDRLTVKDSPDNFAVQIGGGLITHSLFERNRVAVDLYWGGGIQVRHCRFVENRIGINIASDDNSLVLKNTFEANEIGVRIWDEDFYGSSGSTIRRNHFRRNGIGVFLNARNAAHGTDIDSNVFHSNLSSGIAVSLGCLLESSDECAGRGTVIRKNVMIRNGNEPLTLTGSWWLPSGSEPYEVVLDDGLTVFAPQAFSPADGATVMSNVANRNADLGIEAAGVVDGGGNHAARNGDPLECEGVDC
jgi:hypothetical protein